MPTQGVPAGIEVAAEGTGGQVSPGVLALNMRWNLYDRWWDAAADAPRPAAVAQLRAAHLGAVRFPSGWRANLYDWRKAIGPQNQRGCQVDAINGKPRDSVYGPDEHMRFADQAGLDTSFMVAAVYGVRYAGDLVEYMNAEVGANPNGGRDWAAVRAANGHPEPYGITWWEIGNEPHFKNQRYWRSADNAQALRQYVFGGSQRQVDQPVGKACDHTVVASRSDGSPGQRFRLWYPPAVPGSVSISVGGQRWRQVADVQREAPRQRVYEINPATGWVTFGGAGGGMAPPRGAQVTATYVSGPHPGFVGYYRAMKQVDPSIRVCGTWGQPAFIRLMGSRLPYDCLAAHIFSRPGADLSTPVELYDWLMGSIDGELEFLDRLQDAIDQSRPQGRPPDIVVTESGAYDQSPNAVAIDHWRSSQTAVVHDASLLVGYLEHALKLSMIGNLDITLGQTTGPGAEESPQTAWAQVLALAGRLVGGDPLPTTVRQPSLSTSQEYEPLRTFAVRQPDGTVQMFIVNRARRDAVQASMSLEGVTGEVAVTTATVTAGDLTAANVRGSDGGVTTRTAERTVEAGQLDVVLPPHAVTLVTVQQQ